MNINEVDIRQLRYFVAVAEELHFGRAARRLNLSQPPLSQQIKALEHFLGTTLLQRTSRRVALTPAGHYFLPKAKQLLHDLVQIAEETKQAEAGLSGTLRLGVNYSAPFHPLTSRLLHKFRTHYPRVKVELLLHDLPNLLQTMDLPSSDIDLALIWLDDTQNHTDILQLHLSKDEMQVVLPTGHALARQTSIHIRELQDVPFISESRQSGKPRYDCIMKAFATINAQPRTLYESLHMPLVLSMVAAGQGLSLLPAFWQQHAVEGVVFRPLRLPRGKPPHMTFSLISAKVQRNAAAENFIDIARKILKHSKLHRSE